MPKRVFFRFESNKITQNTRVTRVSGEKHVVLNDVLRFHLSIINQVVQFNSALLLSPHTTL